MGRGDSCVRGTDGAGTSKKKVFPVPIGKVQVLPGTIEGNVGNWSPHLKLIYGETRTSSYVFRVPHWAWRPMDDATNKRAGAG